MPVVKQEKNERFDVRVYIGMLFFRWQIIAVSFLYSLLGGVLYVNLTPKQYVTYAKIAMYQDPNLELKGQDPRWTSFHLHRYMLMDGQLRTDMARMLLDKWGATMGGVGRMILEVDVAQEQGLSPMLIVSARSGNPGYAEAFLGLLIAEHKKRWADLQHTSINAAVALIESELAKIDERIRQAQDDVIEYERLHDVTRSSLREQSEQAYIAGLVGRSRSIATQLMMLESQFPILKQANATVIKQFAGLMEAAATIDLANPVGDAFADIGASPKVRPGAGAGESTPAEGDSGILPVVQGVGSVRVELLRLQQQREDMLKNLTADHPRVREIDKAISGKERQLELAAQMQFHALKDQQQVLQIQQAALEAAEYQWQAKDSVSRQVRAEHQRLQQVVSRYESHYQTLYERLHNMRVQEELKAEHFSVTQAPSTGGKPIWPDPMKILLVTLAIGVGSGLGLALAAQVLDNKVQSIADVETDLGILFLGGVPYWVHSGLEKTIRPIVTEEHSTGAIEAYRALRTSILNALDRANEKVVMFTSADSREGKTLTALNTAIMIAQMGKRVLLVDMDLRRGRLHRSLGIARTPGMTDVLRGSETLSSVIQTSRIENLSIIPTGRTIDNVSELLQATQMASLFRDVIGNYDYVIMDTSPVLRVTDTVIVAGQHFGVVVYVTRVNHTPKPLLGYSLDMLKDARILGLVLNSIEMHKISSLYYSYQYPNYAYYSNAYAYGYDYYYYGDRNAPRDATRRRRRRGSDAIGKVGQWFKRTFMPLD